MIYQEDRLCSVLGLQDETADRLANLKPFIRSHQTDMYFILCFLEEDSEYSGSLTDKAAIAKKLQEIGFTKNRSAVVAEWISKQPFPEHQRLYSWVQDYITDMFNYNISLSNSVQKYPYCSHIKKEWFSICVERYIDSEDLPIRSNVEVINTTPGRLDKVIQEKKEKFQKHQSERTLYFHGTDHKGAESIIENGINLGAGKRHCDFSDGCGFYLSTTTEFAISWAKKHKASAVVMFSIGHNCFNKFCCLNLSSCEKDLKTITNHFRKNEKLTKTLRQNYKNCDYIRGPIVQARSECSQQDPMQICIKNANMAEYIGNGQNIYGTIFINT